MTTTDKELFDTLDSTLPALYAWVNEKNIGMEEWRKRRNVLTKVEQAIANAPEVWAEGE